MGAIKNTLFPRVLYEITWMATLKVSITKTPAIIEKTSSCRRIIAMIPKMAPSVNEPISPINIWAGNVLYHKKPIKPPIKAEIKITTHAIEGLSENDFILAAKIDQLISV